jgi:hypothetical protein
MRNATMMFIVGIIISNILVVIYINNGYKRTSIILESQLSELNGLTNRIIFTIPKNKWWELIITVNDSNIKPNPVGHCVTEVRLGGKLLHTEEPKQMERQDLKWIGRKQLLAISVCGGSGLNENANDQSGEVSLLFNEKPLPGTKLWLVYNQEYGDLIKGDEVVMWSVDTGVHP